MSIYFKCSKSLSRFTQSQTWRKVLNTTRSYHNELTTRPALLQPVLFTAGVSIGSFAGCSILQYERVKTKMGEESSISKLLRRRKEKGFEFRNQINKWWNGLHEGHKVAVGSAVPSLGASGALLAVLAACCIERPDARLSILFLPFFTFSAQTALYSIIAIDVTGLLLRWKLFDHAGHLGGTLFGSWYVMKGHEWTWDKRGPFIRWWHELRQSMNEK
eukprot:TCONS_00000103-protein